MTHAVCTLNDLFIILQLIDVPQSYLGCLVSGYWLLSTEGEFAPLPLHDSCSDLRSNIGNAKIDGLVTDLHLGGNKFNIALAVFYVPYILVDVPSNLVLKYFRAGYYLPSLIIGWGLVGMSMGFVKSYTGLIITRFFLGLMEGGLLVSVYFRKFDLAIADLHLQGGMIIYLAMFFTRHQLMFRIGLFYCAAPLSGAFGGLLATGLAKIHTGGYKGWPFIFFVEGGITVLFGILTIFFLPHTPAEAKFLTEEEKAGAALRMSLDAHGADAANEVKDEKFSMCHPRTPLADSG